MTLTHTVDGLERFGKLMNVWPRAEYQHKYVRITAAEFDDIMKTIDYRFMNWGDCSQVRCRFGDIGYVRGRDADAEVLLTRRFMDIIKYEEPKP